MSPRQDLRRRDRTRKFRPDDLPEAETPSPRLELQGQPSDETVKHLAVFPEGARIATASSDGHVRVLDVRGDGDPLVDIPAHAKWVNALAVLDDHVLASAGGADGKLYTWDAGTGERMDTIDVGGSGVTALAAVGPETLAAGLSSGAVVFVQHTCGRQLAEVARDESAHSDEIRDVVWHEDVMVTACEDETARVWSLSTRKPLAVLRGHRDSVWSAAVNSRYIATGSPDETLRLYANFALNGAGFPLVFVLEGLHAHWINSVHFIGSDLIMSASEDYTVCFTAVSPDARPIARLRTKSVVEDAAITVDGHVAWVSRNARGGSPAVSVCAPPSAVAEAAKKHALATFGSTDGGSISSAVVQQVPPPPLQGALVDAQAGRITAGDACRTLLNAERCSASISEWWCGHKLLMLAVERGDVAADCGLEVDGVVAHDYWFKNLYLLTKRVQLGPKDRQKVGQYLAEAKRAGVIEGTQAILVAIEAQLDLREEVTALQDTGGQVLMALSNALLEQALARAELKRLGAELTRMDRVQKISLLLNAVFSVAPLASGAAARAGVAVFGMAPDSIESILSVGVALQGAATPLVVDKFVRHTAQVIASWEAVPVEARESIRAAAEGLGMTWEGFCDIVLMANDVVPGEGGGEEGDDGVHGVDVEEMAGGEKSGSDEAGALDSLDMGRAQADREEGDAGNDRLSGCKDCGPEKSRATEDGRDASSGETEEAKLVQSSSEVGNTVWPTSRETNMLELKSVALNSDEIRRLNEKQTSTLLAAAMVKFDDERSRYCVFIRRAIFRAFHRSFVDGEALIDTLGVDQVLEMVMNELNVEEEYLAIGVAARRVLEDRLSNYLARFRERRRPGNPETASHTCFEFRQLPTVARARSGIDEAQTSVSETEMIA